MKLKKGNISKMSESAKYCLDTNAISDVLNKKYKMEEKIIDEMQKGNKIYISSISFYEIIRGLKASQFAKKLKKLMSDKQLRITFGKNAHEDMKAYAPDVLMQQWDNLFNEITKNDS